MGKSLKTMLCLVVLFAPFAHARYTLEQPMTVANVNGISLAYTEYGRADAPPVLMIMGLTGSHRLWGEDLINQLADAGYRVILFDNRDTGDSARLDALGEPALWWEMLKNALGFEINAPYTLNDMAADGVALLDTLQIDEAHIVGASMGGMIAQIIAAAHPDRATSLVSIMSTTGAPHLPEASAEAQEGLMGIGDADGDQTADLNAIGLYTEAFPRQLMAIVAAGDRSEQVRTIAVPTLVLHGEDDALLPPAHGEHTAELIDGAGFVVYPGMGHDLPAAVVPALVADMAKHFAPLTPVAPREEAADSAADVVGGDG